MTERNALKQFGWKRKIGAKVSKSTSVAFEQESKDEEDPELVNGDVDWLTLVPVKKKAVIGLEDGTAKANRLVQEGSLLAGSERYWEALKKWDEALQYTPCDSKIHEMKAQALMELSEVYPAVQSAKKAVEYSPTWWIGHQTLGRALLGLGEVRMAIRSFSRAIHVNPENRDMWEDDLMWAWSLLQKRERLDEEKKREEMEKREKEGVKITEIEASGYSSDDDVLDNVVDIYRGENKVEDSNLNGKVNIKNKRLKTLPNSYVQMRDPQPP